MCKESWGRIYESSCELAISELIEAFRKLERMLGSKGEFPAGFTLKIEIKEPGNERGILQV